MTVEAETRGAASFNDPALGREGNLVSCTHCHTTTDADSHGLAGGPLGRVAERPSYWGGAETNMLRAVNQCLYWFMGRSQPLTVDEPSGVDLFAFLESLDGDDELATARPFTIGEVAWPGPGDAARGEIVYREACLVCHGEPTTGEGTLLPSAPKLPGDTLAAHPDGQYTDEERRLVFVEKVRHGPFLGYGGTMPPFSLEVLPDEAMADLFTYLGVP